jgi:integrase
MAMPRSAVIGIRDGMSSTPGAADNMVKAIRALYAWGIENGHVSDNPPSNIAKINHGTGAVPWSVDDLQKFRDRHPAGTMAHLALTLFMFSACRIGDAPFLGRSNELQRDGLIWLDWQPSKKGSTRHRPHPATTESGYQRPKGDRPNLSSNGMGSQLRIQRGFRELVQGKGSRGGPCG